MKIAIYGQQVKDSNAAYIQVLFKKLKKENIGIAINRKLISDFQNQGIEINQLEIYQDHNELTQFQPNFLLTLGGDGTILKATTLIKDSRIPILGINMGRMGFLASTEKGKIEEAIDILIKGRYKIEERVMLQMESNFPVFGDIQFALNDFTLHKRDTSSMIVINTYINGEYLNAYWADGLIVSTPTGSTGYSLSCGGPIVFPGSGNFVITPVAPHNLNVRPVVISDDSVISFDIEGRTENYLCTLDSRYEIVTLDHHIAIRKCDFTMRMVLPDSKSFLKTIHDKLTWGADLRN
jgi:NAD+ kinase